MGKPIPKLREELKQYLNLNRNNLKGEDESLMAEVIIELEKAESSEGVNDTDLGQYLIILELIIRLIEVM